jgi:hypothetical protein
MRRKSHEFVYDAPIFTGRFIVLALLELISMVFSFFEVVDDANKKPTLLNVGCAIFLGVLLLASCFIWLVTTTAG